MPAFDGVRPFAPRGQSHRIAGWGGLEGTTAASWSNVPCSGRVILEYTVAGFAQSWVMVRNVAQEKLTEIPVPPCCLGITYLFVAFGRQLMKLGLRFSCQQK